MARLNGIDLFCGAGGMSLGLTQAGIDIDCGVDKEKIHVATYAKNLHRAICTSVDDLPEECLVYRDVVSGGPPCQGFSSIGKRDEFDPRNDLTWHFANAVKRIQPRAFIMENVPGMTRGYGKTILNELIRKFEKDGYIITKPISLIDASAFGVAQKRKRLFILGARRDQGGTILYPKPFWNPPTVWEMIGDLPSGEELPDVAPYSGDPLCERAKEARRENGSCSGNKRVVHEPKTIKMYTATAPGDIVPSHRLPRLSQGGLCPTLRAGTDSSKGAHTAARPIHPKEPRCISVREAARLHGYPDQFEFDEQMYHAYRQIGNSVCPPVAKAIGEEVVRFLGNNEK
jgi:DNA (cytosine-5)-methyltransferase 1